MNINKSRSALLIHGELRFSTIEHLENFKKHTTKFDIFICTYEKYEKLAKNITKNYIIVDHSEIPRFRPTIQWFTLDKLLKNYSTELSSYDTIIRSRTDICILNDGNCSFYEDVYNQKMVNQKFYAFHDFIFGSDSKTFIRLFENYYYDKVLYYSRDFKINHMGQYINFELENLLEVEKRCMNFHWLIYPCGSIHAPNVNVLKKNILKYIKNPKKDDKDKDRIPEWIKKCSFESEKSLMIHILQNAKLLTFDFNKKHRAFLLKTKPERKHFKILEI